MAGATERVVALGQVERVRGPATPFSGPRLGGRRGAET